MLINDVFSGNSPKLEQVEKHQQPLFAEHWGIQLIEAATRTLIELRSRLRFRLPMGDMKPFVRRPVRTDEQLGAKSPDNHSAVLRKSLGLSLHATDKQVDAKLLANTSAAFRKSLGLPSDASRQLRKLLFRNLFRNSR